MTFTTNTQGYVASCLRNSFSAGCTDLKPIHSSDRISGVQVTKVAGSDTAEGFSDAELPIVPLCKCILQRPPCCAEVPQRTAKIKDVVEPAPSNSTGPRSESTRKNRPEIIVWDVQEVVVESRKVEQVKNFEAFECGRRENAAGNPRRFHCGERCFLSLTAPCREKQGATQYRTGGSAGGPTVNRRRTPSRKQ